VRGGFNPPANDSYKKREETLIPCDSGTQKPPIFRQALEFIKINTENILLSKKTLVNQESTYNLRGIQIFSDFFTKQFLKQ